MDVKALLAKLAEEQTKLENDIVYTTKVEYEERTRHTAWSHTQAKALRRGRTATDASATATATVSSRRERENIDRNNRKQPLPLKLRNKSDTPGPGSYDTIAAATKTTGVNRKAGTVAWKSHATSSKARARREAEEAERERERLGRVYAGGQ